MKTIILNLRGPWRSWGAMSIGDDRWTTSRPTASAALGLLGACAGVDRHASALVERWYRSWHVVSASALHWWLGQQELAPVTSADYQTASGSFKIDGTVNADAVVSRRGYLEHSREAVALVLAHDADSALYERAVAGLHNPVFPPYLGRRCNPLSEPPVRPGDVFEATDAAHVADALLARLSLPGLMEPAVSVQEAEICAEAGWLDGWREKAGAAVLSVVRQGVSDERTSPNGLQHGLRTVDVIRVRPLAAEAA